MNHSLRSLFIRILLIFLTMAQVACEIPKGPRGHVEFTTTPTRRIRPTPTTESPILSPTEAKSLAKNLLITNRGCALPCWWGIKPGETNWSDTVRFLEPFSRIGQGGTSTVVEENKTIIRTNYTASFPIDSEDGTGYAIYTIRNDVIQAIHVKETGYGSAYSLQQMLNDYGKPKEVRLSAFSVSLSDFLPFRVLLVYPELGIFALYDYKGKLAQERIVACPDQLGAELWLWNPTQSPDLSGKINPLGPDPVNPLQPIAEISEWTVNTFYEEFRQAGTNKCIDTPIGHWK